MNHHRIFVSAAMMLSISTSALIAQEKPKTPIADQREHTQVERIKEGRQSGELTRKESRKLMREQAKIRSAERRMKSDGNVTAAERARLDRKLDKSSRHIGRQKHDGQAK